MKAEITKILAYGTNYRFMWLKINDFTWCFRITDQRYTELRKLGIPTSQSLRSKK